MGRTKEREKQRDLEKENLLHQRVTRDTLREMVKAESKRATISPGL
jgi:hypothetical protein